MFVVFEILRYYRSFIIFIIYQYNNQFETSRLGTASLIWVGLWPSVGNYFNTAITLPYHCHNIAIALPAYIVKREFCSNKTKEFLNVMIRRCKTSTCPFSSVWFFSLLYCLFTRAFAPNQAPICSNRKLTKYYE